jgi:hypothetical protein
MLARKDADLAEAYGFTNGGDPAATEQAAAE